GQEGQHVPSMAKLTQDFEARSRVILAELFRRLNGRLTEADRNQIEGAFRLLQNQFLHGPISALAEDSPEAKHHTLLEALRKLFRLEECAKPQRAQRKRRCALCGSPKLESRGPLRHGRR